MNICWHMPVLRDSNCGLSSRAVHLAKQLRRHGHAVTFLVDRIKTDIADDSIEGLPLRRLSIKHHRPLHWSLQALHRRRAGAAVARQIGTSHDLVISCQPEVIHAYATQSDRPPVLFVCGGTTLLHDPADQARQTTRRFIRRLPYMLDRCLKHGNEARAFAAADAIVFDSRHTRTLVIDHYGVEPDRCHTVYGGVDDRAFRPPDALTRRRLRRRLGLRDQDTVIVWTGRFSPEKNVALLIQALPLCRRRPDRVFLVGNGPMRDDLVALSKRLGVEAIVHWTGRQGDVRPFLHAADVFAFPSLGESFGGSLIEAMACGLPPVVLRPNRSDVRGAGEEIIEHGRSGLLVDPPEPVAFAQALDRLLQDGELRTGLGAAARRRVVGRFTWSVGGSLLHELVLKLLGQRGAAARCRRLPAQARPVLSDSAC